MEKTTKGAWLLAQSKSLDAVTGAGAARLENISYAGRIGRLYNLLRRNVANDPNPTIDAATVRRICQLNNIDRPSREMGLRVLAAAGRIDVGGNGAVSVLGATSKAVLEVTSDICKRGKSRGSQAVAQRCLTIAGKYGTSGWFGTARREPR